MISAVHEIIYLLYQSSGVMFCYNLYIWSCVLTNVSTIKKRQLPNDRMLCFAIIVRYMLIKVKLLMPQ